MRKKSISQLKKLADKTFSLWIRRKNADFQGYVYCFTCGKRLHWKEAQNSHYVSRMHNSLRYSEINCHPACAGCNVFKHGNMDVYALKLIELYGDGILNWLAKEKLKIKQFKASELEEIIKKYSLSTSSL